MSNGHELTYGQRVYAAYAEIAAERQSPDVPIHALHRRVGGSIHELHDALRAECLAHRAVPSVGEPAFAGDAARQSALRLPGEKETFLSIKLLDPPMADNQQPPQAKRHPTITLTLNANEAHLVAEAIYYGTGELEQYSDGHGRDIDGVYTHCDYLYDLEKGLLAFAENPRERAGVLRQESEAELPDRAIVAQYERLLRQTAALRYPYKERTPELQARIEKTIARKVGEFTQACQVRAYEQSLRRQLAEKRPNLSPAERERYEQRIAKLVSDYRQAQSQQQQQPAPQQQTQPPPQQAQQPQRQPGRKQSQGRGHGMEQAL
jgi:hypothetical protein